MIYITNVTQKNTGMYTKESSQQTVMCIIYIYLFYYCNILRCLLVCWSEYRTCTRTCFLLLVLKIFMYIPLFVLIVCLLFVCFVCLVLNVICTILKLTNIQSYFSSLKVLSSHGNILLILLLFNYVIIE